MLLSQLKKGEKAKIVDLSSLTETVRRRLLDLGISEGSEVCLQCKMPFKGPCMVENCGQSLGIRLQDAFHIKVEKPC
ncbi:MULTISPECIES: FeoA family protein [unclassified Bacillus (in: firmicutes)]|uniref:FeoA family protein n=1 Tax=unclassified Bacillus (in: firmicutes) TaxID=185979 RepID=UPI0008F03E07|nr:MULTISPECIES: FeoA family protein [unclassified Bacillus (in: firmicutes)]SFA89819.1 ferrous iron transport protein A [Bacillus sp. UNCCL13]SFQ85042.1 ferrous iron transport protein A [Bacillus sp. cl95]